MRREGNTLDLIVKGPSKHFVQRVGRRVNERHPELGFCANTNPRLTRGYEEENSTVRLRESPDNARSASCHRSPTSPSIGRHWYTACKAFCSKYGSRKVEVELAHVFVIRISGAVTTENQGAPRAVDTSDGDGGTDVGSRAVGGGGGGGHV